MKELILVAQETTLYGKDQLFHSLLRQSFRFFYQTLHGNAAEISPDLRDDAVGTVLIASLRNLEIGKMPSCRYEPLCVRKRERVDI